MSRFAPIIALALSTTALLTAKPKPVSHLSIAGGIFDVNRSHQSFSFQAQYRWDPATYHIRPQIGLLGTAQSTLYLYGGVGLDIFVGKHLVLTPNFSPGFFYKGSGKDLFFPLEFRSCFEASWRLPKEARVGAEFFHISNASMGRKNPGTEVLLFFYSHPMGST